jgi:hypothetical protein
VTEVRTVVTWGWVVVLVAFWGHGTILYLDLGGDYTGVYMHRHSEC